MSKQLAKSIGKGVVAMASSSLLSSTVGSAIAGCATSCAECPNFEACQAGTAGPTAQTDDFFKQDFTFDDGTRDSHLFSTMGTAFSINAGEISDGSARPVAPTLEMHDTQAVRLDPGSLIDDSIAMAGLGFKPGMGPTPETVATGFTVETDLWSGETVRHGVTMRAVPIQPGEAAVMVEVTDDAGHVLVPIGAHSVARGRPLTLDDIIAGSTLTIDGAVYYITDVSPQPVATRGSAKVWTTARRRSVMGSPLA